MSQGAVPLDGLTGSARAALLKVVAILATGFTGTIELECTDGGVRHLRETRTHRGSELEHLAKRPQSS